MNLEVHIEWDGDTRLAGHLYCAPHSPAVTFEYDREWLERPDAFAIDPTSLPLRRGPQHSGTLFGALQDCGPDRWGRMLVARAVRKHVMEQKPYQDIDYVIALDDVSRIGALRFRERDGAPFLADRHGKIPPVIQLAALKNAADAVHDHTETARDLEYLLGKGSPLGGARPKSGVQLGDGRLAIAKFPKPDDTRDIAAGEVLALEIARRAGINAAEHELVKVDDRNVSLITRFDRENSARIPFISGNSLVGLQRDQAGSYTLLADGIRQLGDDIAADLRELWRRMIFSLLASNYDDHLRNHGFLMRAPGRWALSPAYDLNPVPEIDRAKTSKTPIAEDQEEPSIAAAIANAPRFGMKDEEAMTVLDEVLAAVSDWRKTGKQLRIKASTLDDYSSAFDHALMDEAKSLV